MKRKVILLTLILSLIAVPAFAVAITYKLTPTPYPVLVNGDKLNSNLPIMTYKANGGDNTYVPLRAVLDMMGAKTVWDGKVNITTGADPAKVAEGVVEIYVSKNGRDVEQGSGVLIDYDEILTCSHVVEKGDAYRIIYNDGHTSTAVLRNDKPSEDAAILEPAEKVIKPVKIGDSDEVKLGDKVFVVSSPKEKKNVITSGEVVRPRSTTNSINGFRTSSMTQAGSSGGGVFNVYGGLIGIVSAGDETYSFAVPINDIRKILSN